MCGIVGLFFKKKKLQSNLGEWFGGMLDCMSSRGPDSAGFAIYGAGAPIGSLKLTLQHAEEDFPWDHVAKDFEREFKTKIPYSINSTHAVFVVAAREAAIRRFLREKFPAVKIMSIGQRIQIMKEVGTPASVMERFHVEKMWGSHAIGHTRMATESAVTTAGSHPFSTGMDLCLVHNGSLSNHNRLRQNLRREGIQFQTDNDSEVAAGLPDVAAETGRYPGGGLEERAEGSGRILYVHGRHAGWLCGLARSNRVQTGGDGGDPGLRGDGVGISFADRPAGD